MKYAITLAAVLALFPITVLAKPPANKDLKVACNQGWSTYKQEQGVTGQARKRYMADCMAGNIKAPVKPAKPAKAPGIDD